MRRWWHNLRPRRRAVFLGVALVLLLAAGGGAVRLVRAAPKVPTAEVRRGEFVDHLKIRGEVKAQRSVQLNAPSGAGDLQILKLAKNGDAVKAGDTVVVFDTTDQKQRYDTRRSELKQAEGEIEHARAQGRLTEEKDLTDLAKAKYDVERAKLDVGKQEILSVIDGEKSKLTLSDAEQVLRETEQRLKSDRSATEAAVASLRQKREKALFDVRQAEDNIKRLTMTAPVDGTVTVLTTWRGPGQMTAWREGDRTWPGAAIVELPDMNTVQIAARVDEIDRGHVEVGQAVFVRIDAIPDTEFTGKVEEISPLAKGDFSSWPVVRNFDLRIRLDRNDSRVKVGMSASARIAVDRMPDALLVPAEAAFQKSGKTVVYVLRGSRFEERPIEVARRSNGQLAVASGLKPGERIALKDPTLQENAKP